MGCKYNSILKETVDVVEEFYARVTVVPSIKTLIPIKDK